ncbi:MAG: DUF1559 domain-containing protein [Gemmataceae bacterium]|nr:DUF1559 domain-containing protein [Gemmataceae bacterium]MCI0743454.1 DUF1559 domain-containing protein [Gemmataceae bacterium]
MMMPHATRQGLTRVEITIVLVIAFIALGLFAASIARRREDAGRVQCLNNLRQIGQAILVFEDGKKDFIQGKGYLPAARIADGYATWAVQISAFLQADDPLKDWDLTERYDDQDAKARAAVVPFYFCSTRKRSALVSVAGADSDRFAGALGDYACAAGDGNPNFPWTTEKANGAVILGEVLEKDDDRVTRWQGRTSSAKLPRGKAYTLLIGEKHVPLDEFGKVSVGDGSLYNGAVPASFSRVGGPGYGLAATQTAPFNNNFGSAHTRVVHFLHADGSKQAYTTNMSEDVLGKLINRE